MKTFTLYKENRIDKKYSVNLDQLKSKFIGWMKSKETDWLEYYHTNLVVDFITSKEGMNSVTEDADQIVDIENNLRDVKWDYLNSIGIK